MIEVPAGAPWALHRVALSGRYHDSLHTITTEWSLDDVLDAIDIIDQLDAARVGT